MTDRAPILDLMDKFPWAFEKPAIDTISKALGPLPAKGIVELPNGVIFQLPAGMTKGMNQARITRDPEGLFSMTFERIKRSAKKGVTATPYGEFKRVPLESLATTFFMATGLRPSPTK